MAYDAHRQPLSDRLLQVVGAGGTLREQLYFRLPMASRFLPSPESVKRSGYLTCPPRSRQFQPNLKVIQVQVGLLAGARSFTGHLRRGPQRPGCRTCGSSVWQTVGVRVRPADSHPRGPRAAEWERLGPVQA